MLFAGAVAVVGREDADGEVGVAKRVPEGGLRVAARAARLGEGRAAAGSCCGHGGSVLGVAGVVPAPVLADQTVVEARQPAALEGDELATAPRGARRTASGCRGRVVGGAVVPPAAVRVPGRGVAAGHTVEVRPRAPCGGEARPRAPGPGPSPPGGLTPRTGGPSLRPVAGLVGTHVPRPALGLGEHLPGVLHADEGLVGAAGVRVGGPRRAPPRLAHRRRVGLPLSAQQREQVRLDITLWVVVNARHDARPPVGAARAWRTLEPCPTSTAAL